jgi:macrolide transport system ATP-binding/permease protein
MNWIGEMWRKLQVLSRRGSLAQDLEEEMRLHREMKERELVAGGLATNEARYAAARAFGNTTALNERGREAWGWRWLEDFLQDVRFGVRVLRKNPGFTLTAVLTLALGIGVNTAIFSVVNAVLLQPLPYPEPDRLVWADEYVKQMNSFGLPNPEYTDWALNNHTFEGLGAMGAGMPMNLTRAGQPEQIDTAIITPNLLTVVGIHPALGRPFSAEEVLPGGNKVVILTDGLWKRKFGADPTIVGKGVTLNQEATRWWE